MELYERFKHIIDYIEENIAGCISYEVMAGFLHCSVYELSRVFPYITGVSLSEYIRKRKLSQAVFDIQSSRQSIINVAQRYGYESQSSFSRAFRDLHGVSPTEVRKPGTSIEIYPMLTLQIKIKGAEGMKFRIVEAGNVTIVGLKGLSYIDCDQKEGHNDIWNEFMDKYNRRLYNKGGETNYYSEPYYQVAAYQYKATDGKTPCIIGAELKGKPIPEGMDTEVIPAAKWAVFTFRSPTGLKYVPDAYIRVLTEWFPSSGYTRDITKPNLEVFPPGDVLGGKYEWEIWMPLA